MPLSAQNVYVTFKGQNIATSQNGGQVIKGEGRRGRREARGHATRSPANKKRHTPWRHALSSRSSLARNNSRSFLVIASQPLRATPTRD